MKALLERALVGSGLPGLLRSRLRGRALVLAYHNIVPHGESIAGDRALHLAQREFADQLDSLLVTHEIVPLAELLADRRAEGQRDRPRVAVTFDDAYRGAVTAGVLELELRALPATFFIAPGFVGDHAFWWDAVAGPGGMDDAMRAHALEALRGDDEAVRHWHEAEGRTLREPPSHARCASESELRSAARMSGITFGAHSWSHPNLSRVDEARLAHELHAPLVWLRERFDQVLPVLAYPYGLASESVERAAASAGYLAAFRVDGGWMSPGHEPPYRVARLNVPAGISVEGLELRGAGLFCS